MNYVIKFLGILFILIGIIYALKPDIAKTLLTFFIKGKRIYIAAIIRLTFAVIFFLGASRCARPWIIIIFGILCLLGGLLIFILGPERTRPILAWWQKQPLLVLRLLSLVAVAFGAIILYAA